MQNNYSIEGRIVTDNTILQTVEKNVDELLQSFLDIESLGTHCNPKCGNCLCKKCPIGTNNYSIKEGRELSMIENGLSYDPDKKVWTASYPWIKDPLLLSNNFFAAFARLRSLERRLLKTGVDCAQSYDDQITDMIKRGVARKLSLDEIAPSTPKTIHYITHHEVLKTSKSTPKRIVFNSSLKYMGHSLNDFWAKGPCMINALYAILLRFRQEQVGIAGDIAKMFNSVKLSEKDQDVHRFLWRNLKTDIDPDHYVLTTVTFGDRPSPAIASSSLIKTANMHKNEYPDVCKLVNENSFVDDLITSCPSHDSASRLIKDTEKVLLEGGFKLKEWIVSGSNHMHSIEDELSESREEKILGMLWKPDVDCFSFKISISFNNRKRMGGEDLLKVDEIRIATPRDLTRRRILSQIAKIFDPLGLITPVTLGAKVLMRNLCLRMDPSSKGKWDIPIDDQFREEAIQFFINLFALEPLLFPRCVQPPGAKGNPYLI